MHTISLQQSESFETLVNYSEVGNVLFQINVPEYYIMKIQSYVKRSRRVQTKRVRNRKNKTMRRNRKNHMMGGGLFDPNPPVEPAVVKNVDNGTYTYNGPVVPHGKGVITYTNGNVYDGEFKYGTKFGIGKTTTTTTTTDGITNTKSNGFVIPVIRSKINSANNALKSYMGDAPLMKVEKLTFENVGTYTGTVVPHGDYGIMESNDNKTLISGEFKNGNLYNGTNKEFYNTDGSYYIIRYKNGRFSN